MDKLQQIARKAGVSPNTVLRVLRGENKEVWPSAIRRAEVIRDMAREIAYLPNSSARAMRRGKFNCVALVLSADQGRSYLPNELFNAIHDALAERGMRLIVSKLPDAQLTSEELVPTILKEWSCDGLLINYTDHVPQGMVELIGRYRIPSVWINCRQPVDCVYYDDFGGAMEATQHFLKLGHRRIAYLDFVTLDRPETSHYSRIDRYEGYAQAMRAAGLVPVAQGQFAGIAVPRRLEMLLKLLSSPERPTAIISYDAGERLLYAAALKGLRVPEDLSLMTFGPLYAPANEVATGENYIGKSAAVMRLTSENAGRQAV